VPWPDIDTTPGRRTIKDRLSKRSEVVFERAILESKKFCHSKISVETIMLGLLYEIFGPTYEVFSLLDLNLINSRKILAASCRRHSARTVVFRLLSANALRLMERAWEFAQGLKLNRIEPEHIVIAIAEEEHGVASFVCEALAIGGSLLRAEVITAMNKSKKCSVPS
jgi:ATP-dependent Clp protease ATP-binding subunit ClpA